VLKSVHQHSFKYGCIRDESLQGVPARCIELERRTVKLDIRLKELELEGSKWQSRVVGDQDEFGRRIRISRRCLESRAESGTIRGGITPSFRDGAVIFAPLVPNYEVGREESSHSRRMTFRRATPVQTARG
jgi:hypothetical protein